MNPISIPEPSLSSRAMLCTLSISMWSARKHDPDASQEIAQRHGAQPSSFGMLAGSGAREADTTTFEPSGWGNAEVEVFSRALRHGSGCADAE